MRDLPYLVIAGFLLLWGILSAARAPILVQPDPVATPPTLYPDQALPPDVAELPDSDPSAFVCPPSLVYPGWRLSQATPTETVATTPDALTTVRQWYSQKLPSSAIAEFRPRKHLIVTNDQYDVELPWAMEQTTITIRRHESPR